MCKRQLTDGELRDFAALAVLELWSSGSLKNMCDFYEDDELSDSQIKDLIDENYEIIERVSSTLTDRISLFPDFKHLKQ